MRIASQLVMTLSFAGLVSSCPVEDDCAESMACDGPLLIGDASEIDAISQCNSVEGSLSLHLLRSFKMSCLETVYGGLYIRHNHAFTVEMPALTSVDGDVEVWANYALTELDIPTLTSVGSLLLIWGNDSLSSLDGLPSLSTVGNLEIRSNDSLSSLSGLSSLTAVSANLSIYDNDCLNQAEAEAFATSIDVGGNVKVEGNGANFPCR